MGDDQTLRVFEIFASIQGESTRAGLPCSFVRLAGCPLRCVYCDTVEAREAEGREMGVDQVVERVLELGHGLIEVTGGEPLHQPAAAELLAALCETGLEVLLETSGAVSIAGLDPRVRVVLDVKTPGSGMTERMRLDNLERLRPGRDEVKFVITSREDFDWAVSLALERGIAGRVPLLVSPVGGAVEPAEAAQWILESEAPLRLQLQLHKIIWGEEVTER
jgi:7-carboxy-7-deazaguanine synthase